MTAASIKTQSVAEWQKRITDAFAVNDIVGVRFLELQQHEDYYTHYLCEKFHGHNIVMNAFFDFYTDTLEVLLKSYYTNGWPNDKPWYSILLTKHISLLRSFRASEKIFYSGYPQDAFGLLRDVKDRAIHFGAALNFYTTIEKLEGIGKFEIKTRDDYIKSTKNAEDERARAARLMIGNESGLPEKTLHELRKWSGMFHMQIHGAKFSDVEHMGNLNDGTLSVHPTPDDLQIALYMNRALELAWIIIRLLCALQITPKQLGGEWLGKWHILDDSFRYCEESLGELNKPIAYALIELIDTKFLFYPEKFIYVENKC